MSKVVLIGSSSAIAKSLQENSNREFVCFTRSNGFDISGDLSELDDLGDINGTKISDYMKTFKGYDLSQIYAVRKPKI